MKSDQIDRVAAKIRDLYRQNEDMTEERSFFEPSQEACLLERGG